MSKMEFEKVKKVDVFLPLPWTPCLLSVYKASGTFGQ